MAKACKVSLIFLCAFFSSTNGYRPESSSSSLKVCYSDGCVQGKTEDGNLKPYDAWYGIPYASPPINELRFKVRHEEFKRILINYQFAILETNSALEMEINERLHGSPSIVCLNEHLHWRNRRNRGLSHFERLQTQISSRRKTSARVYPSPCWKF